MGYFYADFGDVEVAKLVDFFSPLLQKTGIEPNMIEMEWSSLKDSTYSE